MSDPLNPSKAYGFARRSSDQAASCRPRFARCNAPEGNACYTDQSRRPQQQQQQQQTTPSPLPSYYSFDPYAQAAWDWTQSLDLTPLDLTPLVEPLAPPPPRPAKRAAQSPAMKRKSDADGELQDAGIAVKRRAGSRTSSTASQSPAPTVVAKGTGPLGRETDVSEPRRVVESTGSADNDVLPAGRVFPIQIGSALFRLSGASLCSDAPSYFSYFFSDQLRTAAARAADVRTLYIDRDPDTFRDIALHLQGYHVVPRDGEHFVKLFADAQFYSLPRLAKQLFNSDIFISIGRTPFRIPRDSFSAPGNSPNYFSLGFAQWFSTPTEVFPGLDRNALLRPPSISPPSVPNRSPDIFADLMKMLHGYDVEIRNETHRANLLRDARYFHLKGLEQKLIACETTYNLQRKQHEILIRLEDIRQSGVGFHPDPSDSAQSSPNLTPGSITYARPYTDDATTPHHLILETSTSEPASLALSSPSTPDGGEGEVKATFTGSTLRRITALAAVIANKLALPSTHSLVPHLPCIPVAFTPDTALTLDGAQLEHTHAHTLHNNGVEWTLRRAHWRVRVDRCTSPRRDGGDRDADEETWRVVLHALSIDAFTAERARNGARRFLDRG